MSDTTTGLESELERILADLAAETHQGFSNPIRRILHANLERCRIESFLQGGATFEEYVRRVVSHYEKSHEYVRLVQVERDPDVWEDLYIQLQKWAYNLLRQKNFPPYGNRYEHVLNCAAEAAIVIVNAYYPFDVEFGRWAYVVLQNVCLRYIHKHSIQRSVKPEDAVALDQWEGWLHNIVGSGGPNDMRQIELRHDLLRAISKLSGRARSEFILLYYFENRSYSEIAERMGKSINSLYKLHFDALKQLRDLWFGAEEQ